MTPTTKLIAAAIIAGAFAVGFFSGPALAEPQGDARQFEFKFEYAQSELGSTPKAKKMLSRLKREVGQYCGDNRLMSLAERDIVRQCVAETMKITVDSFKSSTVAEAYKSRTGG